MISNNNKLSTYLAALPGPGRTGAFSVPLSLIFSLALSLQVAAAEVAKATPQENILRHCGEVAGISMRYVEGLIKVALDDQTSVYSFDGANLNCTQRREMTMLEEGRTDFMWAGTTPELERRLIPIRIPLYKGLMGFRILLINRGDEARFSEVHSLDQLRGFKFGQGDTWADTDILEAEEFSLVTSNDIHNLFKMLSARRFDALPRGLVEPWDEVEKMPELNFSVEEELLIVYPLPAYIFVSPHRPDLAKKLEAGLLRAIEDGRFDQYLLSDPRVSAALKRARLQERRLFRLNNPFLSDETPLDNPDLWFDSMILQEKTGSEGETRGHQKIAR